MPPNEGLHSDKRLGVEGRLVRLNATEQRTPIGSDDARRNRGIGDGRIVDGEVE